MTVQKKVSFFNVPYQGETILTEVAQGSGCFPAFTEGIYWSFLWRGPVFQARADKSFRAISTARLNTLLCLHLQPIDVVVYDDPQGKSNLVVGFALRCFQRLSRPDADTQRCPWRDNWYTGGRSITVLSY